VTASIPILISAGEASGDHYGALLIRALRQRLGAAEFFGCAGERMQAAGCEALVDAAEVAMVGLAEVIPGLPRVWRAFSRMADSVHTRRPAFAVLIDFPDFNLRLAKKLKLAGVPVIYFVAPQVWAWRPWRLGTIRENVDRLLCIFPFEEKFFREAGVAAEFVGHPLVGRVAPAMAATQFRSQMGIPEGPALIALLPGSRRKEIALNLPPLLAAARLLAQEQECCFVLPVASTVAGEFVRSCAGASGVPLFLVRNQTYDAVAHAAVAWVASGTATIETALLGTPMVVVYRVSAATWQMGRHLVRTPFYSMVNLVAGREIVPELIQDRFQPEAVFAEARKLLCDPAARERMRTDLGEIARLLRPPRKGAISGAAEDLREKRAGASREEEFPDAIQRAAEVAESIWKGTAYTENRGSVSDVGIRW